MKMWRDWKDAPRDGTVFAISTIVTFDPITGQLHALYHNLETGQMEWCPHLIHETALWTDLPPIKKPKFKAAIEWWRERCGKP